MSHKFLPNFLGATTEQVGALKILALHLLGVDVDKCAVVPSKRDVMTVAYSVDLLPPKEVVDLEIKGQPELGTYRQERITLTRHGDIALGYGRESNVLAYRFL